MANIGTWIVSLVGAVPRLVVEEHATETFVLQLVMYLRQSYRPDGVIARSKGLLPRAIKLEILHSSSQQSRARS